jgi:hypothetical protein
MRLCARGADSITILNNIKLTHPKVSGLSAGSGWDEQTTARFVRRHFDRSTLLTGRPIGPWLDLMPPSSRARHR